MASRPDDYSALNAVPLVPIVQRWEPHPGHQFTRPYHRRPAEVRGHAVATDSTAEGEKLDLTHWHNATNPPAPHVRVRIVREKGRGHVEDTGVYLGDGWWRSDSTRNRVRRVTVWKAMDEE